MRVTDEMIEAARDAVRRVTGGAFTPSGLLTRTALEAALAAAPQAAPVAWNWMLDGAAYGPAYYGVGPDLEHVERAAKDGRLVRYLYAAPQPAPDGKLREAALMALEALVYHREQTRPIDRTDAAIAALREALGEQE